MGEVNLTINGRNYGIACDDGQEQRVMDLGNYVDQRMKQIAGMASANNESHLFVLTSLMLADEIHDLRESLGSLSQQAGDGQARQEEEVAVAQAIDHLADRIENIAERIQKA